MSRFYRLYAIIRIFKNWPEIFWAKLSGRTPALVLWSGRSFYVENLNSNLMTIIEVWKEKQYGDGPYGSVVDLGANIGAFSVYAALSGSKVRAYEPEKKNCELLRKNTEGLDVEVFEAGVAGVAGEKTLHVVGESSGKNSLYAEVASGKQVVIRCVTLADILSSGPCDTLKMDIEGAEYEVLFSTPKELLPATILMEWHHCAGSSKSDILAYLGNDFTVTDIAPSLIKAVRR